MAGLWSLYSNKVIKYCDTKDILIFSEDIGRHNAIDKIFGECILKDIPTDDQLVITSSVGNKRK